MSEKSQNPVAGAWAERALRHSLPPLSFALMLLGSAAPVLAVTPAAREPVVRIGIAVEREAAVIECAGRVRVWRRGTGLRGSTFGPGVRFELSPTPMDPAAWSRSSGLRPVDNWGLRLGHPEHGNLGPFAEELVFEPLENAPLKVDENAYRGEFLVRVARPGRLTVINAVHFEDYLKGVVPEEIGAVGTPLAALQAQAIAARSYALRYLERWQENGFDLHAGPSDQVYGGISAEQDVSSRAIIATRGIVAVYKGEPIRANYCSTCGGETESSHRIWPGEKFPYLRAVHDRQRSGPDLCAKSRYHRWEERWSCAQLQQIIAEYLPREVPRARGRELGRLEGLKAIKRSPSGRIEVLEIQTEGGNYRVRGDRIRWVLRRPDGGLLRSTLIGKLRVERGPNCTVTLQGRGWGHGVGMCQTGAMELARRGRSAPDILRHYYRGITLERWWD